MDIGMMWGLKSLSPKFRGWVGGDFANRPLSFNAAHSQKIMIVMSDGDITAQFRPKDVTLGNVHTNRPVNRPPNGAMFKDYGNESNMQEIRPVGSASVLSSDDSAVGRFKLACERAKAQNVDIFTIGFQISQGSLADTILRACATSPSYYYHVEGLDLSKTFGAIASQISNLRLIE